MAADPSDIPRRLPRGSHGLDRGVVAASQRTRLLEAVGRAVAEKGYAAATIDDIVRGAGVSKKTFYEHFRRQGGLLPRRLRGGQRGAVPARARAARRRRRLARAHARRDRRLPALARRGARPGARVPDRGGRRRARARRSARERLRDRYARCCGAPGARPAARASRRCPASRPRSSTRWWRRWTTSCAAHPREPAPSWPSSSRSCSTSQVALLAGPQAAAEREL